MTSNSPSFILRLNFLLTSFAILATSLRSQTNTFPSSGAVGIGTTTPNPGAGLTVYATNPYIEINSAADKEGALLFFDNSNLIWHVGNNYNNAGDGNLYIYHKTGTGNIIMGLGVTTDVGIATATPSYPLEVAGNGSQNIGITNSSGHTYFQAKPASGYNTYYDNLCVGSDIVFRCSNALSGDTNAMLILSNGYVGIGTNSPSYPLSVNGTVQAKEVLVNTGWSDYVFDKGYKLDPLSDVEKTILEKGHLSGIPSAKEVAEKGINLGDMQARLLAKIEELTLHEIEQEKRLNAQEARIKQLEAENSAQGVASSANSP